MKSSGTVVIVTHNSIGTIVECLYSLRQSEKDRSFLTVVVDNCSDDGTPELIKADYPWVQLIESLDNGGFGAGNNQGIAVAEGEWVFFLNPDATISPDSISILAQNLLEDDTIGIIAPAVIDASGNKTVSYFAFLNFWTSTWNATGLQKLFPINKLNGKWSLRRTVSTKMVYVDRVIGAAMMARGKTLHEVGDFDIRYFLFSEEEDLCFRINRAGWKVVYFPEAEAQHIGGVATQKSVVISMAAVNWSRYLFLRKFHGELVSELSRWIWIFALIARLIATAVIRPPRSNSNVLKGYIESIRSLISPGYFDRNLRPKRKTEPISNPSL